MTRWFVDGNNVYGSRPDGWWNDRPAAQRRLAQQVAEWCRTHDDPVVLVYDAPLADETALLAGGNLTIVESRRRGRDAADHDIVEYAGDALAGVDDPHEVVVVTSDRGLRARLPPGVTISGVRRFRELIGD